MTLHGAVSGSKIALGAEVAAFNTTGLVIKPQRCIDRFGIRIGLAGLADMHAAAGFRGERCGDSALAFQLRADALPAIVYAVGFECHRAPQSSHPLIG